ncbi:MAG TPA: hypothetical protein PLW34_09265 [Termitinemataceae bacterium]|nr:hypothetical protein [Termitinemataceae bacterium]HOM23957.1 hypothetical protein [Termitinemataceae bacterium]HPQ01020.1 hypothetical protein [Termitinemataceae bacterium]
MKLRKLWKWELTLFFLGGVLFLFSSCADPLGLHNQEAAKVTFVIKNFSNLSGSYAIPGDFNNWDNSTSVITLKDGKGTSSVLAITRSAIKCTVVPVGSWTRPWYPATQGNAIDETQNVYHNFYISGITLGDEVTITIDGSTAPATIRVE